MKDYPRILITGADGLIGQALQRKLALWPEADVLATGRETTARFDGKKGGYTAMDVTDSRQVEQMMLDFAPTVVLHLAAMSKVEACEDDKEMCWRINVDATANLARMCRHHGARLVFLSTDFLFDGQSGPYAEDDYPAPLNAYGRSKQAAENAIRLSGLNRWTVVRTSLVFGSGDDLKRNNIATLLARELKAGRKFEAATDQFRTPTYVRDLADGILRTVRFDKDGTFHIAGRDRMHVFDFCKLAARTFGFDLDLIKPTTTAALHPDAPRPLDGGLLILRAETELGFKPTSLTKALRKVGHELGLLVNADS
ncbi:MAG: SDR family oxidoreductase [Rubricoccaceae bacterium]|nr:SDR family oxidoreductase [Rubricoccaceae bacterium]